MTNPQTVNCGIIVPNTGADVDLWGQDDVNPNMVAIDGYLAGVQTIAVSNAPITLTSPAGFLATPSPGPTQAQNRVLRFTGAMTGDVRIHLPLPGLYTIENLTTGAFVLSFQGVTATEVIAVDQGERQDIYNDGANVRFVNMGRVGHTEMWSGLTAIPAWVAACTVRPYLLNDGTVYNVSDFPALGARLLGKFGGNGINTFAVQDDRGRVALPYDGTGTRITAAGCGINGQTIGASLDAQTVGLLIAQIPSITSANAGAINISVTSTISNIDIGLAGPGYQPGNNTASFVNSIGSVTSTGTLGIGAVSVTSAGTLGQAHNNVQPSIVTGISVTKT